MTERLTQQIAKIIARAVEVALFAALGLLVVMLFTAAARAQGEQQPPPPPPPPTPVSSSSSSPTPQPTASVPGPFQPTPPEKISKQRKGFQLSGRVDGSTSENGQILAVTTTTGYNFTHWFGLDVSVPFFFTRTSGELSRLNPSGITGDGVGGVSMDARFTFDNPVLAWSSTMTGIAPSGDPNKGQGTGDWTYLWTNNLAHEFGRVEPYVEAGVGNTVLGTTYLKRPFVISGYAGNFEGGLNIGIWKSLTGNAALYDVLPWGPQTLFSRYVRKAGARPDSRNPRDYLLVTTVIGGPDLVRDNGYNLGLNLSPNKVLDFSFGFSHSVRLKLDTFSWGVGFNVSNMFTRSRPH